MKKIIFIMLIAFGMIAQAQTNYSPEILSNDFVHLNGIDTVKVRVYQTMGAWYDGAMKINLSRYEFMNNDTLPRNIEKFTFTQNMADTITHTRDNGNEITNTGRYFTEIIFESGAINWALWQELGRSIYFEYWDVNQEWIIKD